MIFNNIQRINMSSIHRKENNNKIKMLNFNFTLKNRLGRKPASVLERVEN